MIKILPGENDEFIFKGTMDLGILGEFKDDMVEIQFNKDDLNDEYAFIVREYKPLKKYVNKNMSNEEIAEGLTKFYIDKQKDIKKHINEITERYLIRVIGDIVDTAFEFWEEEEGYSQFIIPEKMPKCPKEELHSEIHTSESSREFSRLFTDEEGYHVGEMTVKEYLNKHFPMIDFDKFISAIYPEYIVFEGDCFSLQCSSNDCDYGIVCSACAEYLNDYTIEDWHNF